MAKTVKYSSPLTRPYYNRQPQDRAHIVATPRYNEYPVPTNDIISQCNKVAREWLPHINGVLSLLLDETLWRGDEIQKFWATQQILLLMEWLYECGSEDDMPQLRQSPNDPCVMQQLINGQWVTAFDYGLCLKKAIPAIPTDVIIENVNTIVQESQSVFDDIVANGVVTEYPLADNSPVDPLNAPKNAILCMVVRDYITKLADFIQALAQTRSESQEPDFLRTVVDWGTTLGSGALFWGAMAGTGGLAGWLLALTRIGAGANFLANTNRTINTTNTFIDAVRAAYFNDNKTSVVIDNDQRNEIICLIYDNLKDKPLTQTNFNDAVSSLPETTNVQQAIKNVTMHLFLQNTSYAEFIMVYNQMMIAQQTGAEYPDNGCGCDEPPLECGISYNWLGVEVMPTDVTFYESVPYNALPVQIYPPPLTPIAPNSPFVINQFVSIYEVYELPCNKPISATWWRANTNSASATIETYDGVEWTTRATSAISVGTVIAFKVNMAWSNPTNITYQGCRVRVTSPAPRIDSFVIG